jgi:hypothetical protein
LNAINWTAQAWGNVTDDTIYRCWQRTGILPNEEMIEENDEEMFEGGSDELEYELEYEENAVQTFINQMNVDDITANNYINIDSRIEIAEMIDEEEIIAAVQEAPEEEEEEETVNTPISYPIALDSIQNLFNYLQQNSDIKVNSSVISGLKDLQHQIRRKQNASLKQPTLESFYNK